MCLSIHVQLWSGYVSVAAGIVVGDSPRIITECALRDRLSCEPTVRVRRADIISRWRESCDLNVLIYERDEDWHELNVLGNSLTHLITLSLIETTC